MKRKIMITMLMGIILSMSGCNTSPKPGGILESEEVVNTQTAVEPEATQAPPETSNSASTENQQTPADPTEPKEEAVQVIPSAYLDVTIDYVRDSYYDEVSMMDGYYGTIQLNTDKYPALTEAVNQYNEIHSEESQAYLDELKKNAMDEIKEYGSDTFMGPYVSEWDTYIRRADSQVLSVAEAWYSYSGGAHGNNCFNSVNFDVQTGDRISLESVVKDVNSLPEILETKILAKYPDITYWADSLADVFKEYIESTDPTYSPEFTWTLDYDGITFYFGNYEIGSYVDGTQQVTILYKEYPELLNSKYFEEVKNDYVIKLMNSWNGADTDLNGDGITDYISITGEYSPETGSYETCQITVNDTVYTNEIHYYEMTPYLVKAGEHTYLYIEDIAESDFTKVSVYEITNSLITYKGEFHGVLKDFINSSDFKLTKRMDLLSTYFAKADCYVGSDGMPVERSNVYVVDGEMKLTSTVEITAELVDENGNLLGATYLFPEGTDFQFMATDGETYADMLADDGQRCRFYSTPDWPVTINGMDATQSFETLWYAG